MQTEWTITAYLPLVVNERTLVEELECEVTVSAEEDGCGGWFMLVQQIDTENHSFDYDDTKGDTLEALIADNLFRAAMSDEQLKGDWADKLYEAREAA